MRTQAWSLVYWDASKRAFRPRSRSQNPLNALASQNPGRSTPVNRSTNAKLRVFRSALRKSPAIAEHMLELWAPELSPELLEQFCLQYTRTKGVLDGFPNSVQTKLKEQGLLAQIEAQLEIAQRAGSQNVQTERKTNLELINEGANESSLDLQLKIDKNEFMSPELQDLESRWVSELYENFKTVVEASEPSQLSDLLVKKQCEIVASVLAKYVSRCVYSQPVRGVDWLSRTIGDRLEAEICGEEDEPWSIKAKILLGSQWLERAIRVCKFTTSIKDKPIDANALRASLCVTKTSKRNVIVVHKKLKHWLARHGLNNNNYSVQITRRQIPLLIPPYPWISTRSPSRLSASKNMQLVSSPSLEGEATVSEAIKTGAAFSQLRGVNRLQSQSWKINHSILQVIKASEPPVTLCSSKLDPRGGRLAQDQSKKIIALAESLADREFYLPMYMDFRGRCYASPRCLLNFMGNDAMRSLFLFGKAKPLGPDGLHWLEIHLANMYGECKSQSFDSRRKWVAQNQHNIESSVESPLKNTWWKQSKRPFETLAACQELCRAWKHPHSAAVYECALPIQLDGTSNGLQHLVALARSTANAPLINLAPNKDNSCGDVYQTVAEHVAPSLPRDVIKKALLTYFYGASVSSIAQLVLEETGLRQHDGNNDVSSHHNGGGVKQPSEVATDIATRISQMFKAEQSIQNWLVECARRITNSRDPANLEGSAPTLTWTNPLGFPVVQPYTEPKFEAVKTALQTYFVPSSQHQPVVDPKKQVMGIVANFVHSLDASHMLKTAQSMPPELSFSAVHDSFWTHAGSVSQLNQVLRSQFIDLHTPNLLENVRQEWLTRYGNFVVKGSVHSDSPLYKDHLKCGELNINSGHNINWKHGVPRAGSGYLPSVKAWFPLELPHPPALGKLDISEVAKSEYFFS